MSTSSTPTNGANGHARRSTEMPVSPEGFRDELARIAADYERGAALFAERRARLPDTLRALATVLREAATVLSRMGLTAEIDRLPSPRPLERGLVLKVGGSAGDGADAPAEQPAQLRIEVRADARLEIAWVGHALAGEVARELRRDTARAPSDVGILQFKREVVRFLDAALASSFRGG